MIEVQMKAADIVHKRYRGVPCYGGTCACLARALTAGAVAHDLRATTFDARSAPVHALACQELKRPAKFSRVR
jgi:hypothetical protein